VISTAIAVLIIAFLSVAMWAGSTDFSGAAQTTRTSCS
jgi:type IV secretory pathway VirB2 component (pilin)